MAENVGTPAIAAGGGMHPYGKVPGWVLVNGAPVAVVVVAGGRVTPGWRAVTAEGLIPGEGSPPASGAVIAACPGGDAIASGIRGVPTWCGVHGDATGG